MTDPGWTIPLYLARTAWADLPYDLMLDRMIGDGRAHLLDVTGDVVPMTAGVEASRGPAAVFPQLITTLRAVREHPAAESLSLVTAAPGDVGSVPAVTGLADEVLRLHEVTLVRDPVNRSAVALGRRAAGPDVVRWTIRGIADCPVAPQPAGVAGAGAELSRAVGDAAEAIARVAVGSGEVAAEVEIAPATSALPPGLRSRVLDLLDRADQVDAIMDAALRRRLEGRAVSEREPLLRALRATVDAARRAAVAEAGQDALNTVRTH